MSRALVSPAVCNTCGPMDECGWDTRRRDLRALVVEMFSPAGLAFGVDVLARAVIDELIKMGGRRERAAAMAGPGTHLGDRDAPMAGSAGNAV